MGSIIYPDLWICSVETLNERYNLFTNDSLWFKDQENINSPLSAYRFYDSLVKDRNLPASGYLTGYGGFAIAYGFQHATPDNSLPILWERTDNWEPLLER